MISQRSLLPKMPNTSSPVKRQRHSSRKTLGVAKALIFWQSSRAELSAVLGWCAACEDTLEGHGWFLGSGQGAGAAHEVGSVLV